MADIITNLHPDNDPNTNLYPNIKKENIPNKSINTNKLDDDVLSLIGSLKPSGTDTSTNILAFTSNKGIYVATDNGHWYYWNGSAYANGGVYQSSEDIKQIKEDLSQLIGRTKNLLDESGFTNGTIYSNGTTGASNDAKLSPNVKVAGLSKITVYISATNTTLSRCFYDANGDPIGVREFDLHTNTAITYTVPSGAVSFRFATANATYADMTNASVESGESYTGYVPYGYIISPAIESIRYTNINVGSTRAITTLRGAIETIAESVSKGAKTKSNYYNRYNILLDGETFDILSEFTLAELTNVAFQGIFLPDYVNIYGSKNTVIEADWDSRKSEFDTEADFETEVKKNRIAPLNMYQNHIVKDLTIRTHHMRYCVHDEDSNNFVDSLQTFENVTFVAEEANSNIRPYIYTTPIGMGISNRKVVFNNCVFENYTQSKDAFFMHSGVSADKPSCVKFNDCLFMCSSAGHSIRVTSYGEQAGANIILNECNLFDMYFDKNTGYTGKCDFEVLGGGNTDFIYSIDDVTKIKIDTVKVRNNWTSGSIPKGSAVRWHSNNTVMPYTTASETAVQFYGIALENIAPNEYGLVKVKGMIAASDTSLGTSNAGSLIGIANKTIAEVLSGYNFGVCPIANWIKLL